MIMDGEQTRSLENCYGLRHYPAIQMKRMNEIVENLDKDS
jgi:hypothetical protein